MNNKSLVLLSASLLIALGAVDAVGQRRARPGTMKHTEAEAVNALKTTDVKATYIKDGSTFFGDVYLVGEAAGIKIGTAIIEFSNGKYTLNFTNKKFDVTETTSTGRKVKTKQKLGEDFSYGGAYKVVEQSGKVFLLLYADSKGEGQYDKIKLSGKNATEFEFAQDDVLMRMQYRRY